MPLAFLQVLIQYRALYYMLCMHISFKSYNNPDASTIIIPNLQMRKLRLRKVKQLSHGHPDRGEEKSEFIYPYLLHYSASL